MDFLSAASILIKYSDTVFREQAVSMETKPAVSRWLKDGHSESMGPRLRSGFWAGTSHVDAMRHGEMQKMNHHPPSKHWLVIYTTILYCVAAWAPDLSPWKENAGNLPPSLRNPQSPPPPDSCLGRGNVRVFCPSCLWVDVLCRIFKFQKCLQLLKLFCPHLGSVSIFIRPSLF